MARPLPCELRAATLALYAVPNERLVLERPPAGAGRGVLSVPPAAVVAVAALIVLAVLAHAVYRARRR